MKNCRRNVKKISTALKMKTTSSNQKRKRHFMQSTDSLISNVAYLTKFVEEKILFHSATFRNINVNFRQNNIRWHIAKLSKDKIKRLKYRDFSIFKRVKTLWISLSKIRYCFFLYFDLDFIFFYLFIPSILSILKDNIKLC